jgi:nucleotide-binding universal stress UspA family protein
MAKYKKILVAYDGSPSSRNALGLASQLAREEKSWIKVVAVVPVYDGDLELIGVRNIKETITGPGKDLLQEAQEIADREDVHILTDLEQGEPYERIVHVAEEENCDLIVMGRKGINRLARELMGSVTARVIGHTNKNVLVVPENAKLAWDEIVVALDDSAYSKAAHALALDLAGEHSSRLTGVSVVYTNDEFSALAPSMVSELIEAAKATLEGYRKLAADRSIEMATVVKEGEPYEGITNLAAEKKADLIVIGSHGRKGISRLLMGSVTERTIGYAPCPVLVTHQQ